MAGAEEILAAIEAIYAAGLDAEQWLQALTAMVRVIGGIGATLETYDAATMRLDEFRGVGLLPAQEASYLADFIAINPRTASILRLKPGSVIWDSMVLEERAMNRDAFYSDFLPQGGLRYFIGGNVPRSDHLRSFVTIQRTPKQGHVDQSAIARMQLLLPHVQRAMDVARRLKGSTDVRVSLEGALGWLSDGVALVRADGMIVYANESMQEIARRSDGIRIKKNALDFTAQQARARLDAAIGDICRTKSGEVSSIAPANFAVPRSSGASSYLVSVRALPDVHARNRAHAGAVAMVFVHDPRGQAAAAIKTLRDIFGFTDAEAHLAQALLAGTPLSDYAQARAVSLNTIYTHLRRIKEKTGCGRMTQLIRKLNELQLSLRER